MSTTKMVINSLCLGSSCAFTLVLLCMINEFWKVKARALSIQVENWIHHKIRSTNWKWLCTTNCVKLDPTLATMGCS